MKRRKIILKIFPLQKTDSHINPNDLRRYVESIISEHYNEAVRVTL